MILTKKRQNVEQKGKKDVFFSKKICMLLSLSEIKRITIFYSFTMQQFISQNQENGKTEFLIDTKIFDTSIAMKSAYAFLDRAYFFFYSTTEWLIVQITPKEWQSWNAEKFAWEYSDELLATLLRVKIEEENKIVRETIVRRALWSYADLPHFTSVDISENPSSQIDFDKDIDEILKEIENDPDLKIDEEEINRILAEIEAETQSETQKKPILDPNKLKDVKKNFQRK
jgi:His-Xaa-Ser system protein HxsD